MKVEFTEEASADLDACISYIHERNPRAAFELLDEVLRVVDALADREFEGTEVTLANGERVRTWPVAPLRIYYERGGDDVLRVLRVYHHARRPIAR